MDWSAITSMEYWGWWLVGLGLVVIEMLMPGVVFLWLAIAAFIVGAIMLVIPDLAVPWQIGLFALFSVISIVAGRMWFKRHPIETDDATLNRRGEQYVGQAFTLEDAIVNGKGKLKVDDTTWRVEGDDMTPGTKVTVTGVDGVILRVRAAD
ncbi:MAG: NfeD family protein [Alphaproteobacteria bacterium]